jgi:hypothetical protein
MKILVGYDGSNMAKAALELAKKCAKVWEIPAEIWPCWKLRRPVDYLIWYVF